MCGLIPQSVIAMLPAAESELYGHEWFTLPEHHDPAGHSLHDPPMGPYFPALQVHCEGPSLPVESVLEPKGHEEQAASDCVDLYLPTAHRVQTDDDR